MKDKINKEKPLVFIVEDNEAYRILLGKILEKKGFMVMMFEHGRKAADMLNYIQPALILSDISMPCMDGFELHRFVKENYSGLDIPFVYLSSSNALDDIQMGTSLGAKRMLGKPISAEDLAETIDTVLNEAV